MGHAGAVAVFPIPSASTDLAAEATSNPGNHIDISDIVDGFIPLVPTSSVAVLRARRGIIPQFLAVLLRSPAYRNWLSGHARGTTIRRLTLRTLRRLRVPVPPVPVQEAVLREVPILRGDAIAVLVRLLSGASNDPVTVWLETPLVARLASGSTGGDEADRLGGLVAAAEAIQSLVVRTTRRSDSASPEIDDRRVSAWVDVVRRAAAALDGVASIPRGAGRLTILGAALARLLKALDVLDKAEGLVVDRLYSFTRAMVELCEDEIHAMQESVTLDIGVEPAEVIVGAVSEVRLRLTNASAVPLRGIVISTRPPVGTGEIPYLADGEARRLVTEPVEGRLSYLPHARDRVVKMCAGHPFLIQSLCNRVFERAASGSGPTITLDAVERAATEMVRDNEHFRTLWDYAGSARRRLLLALCDRLSEEPDAVNLDLLAIKLRDCEVPFRRATDLADDIDELRELELLDVDSSYRGGTYRLSVPLMANWLRTNVNFGELLVRAKQEAMEAVW